MSRPTSNYNLGGIPLVSHSQTYETENSMELTSVPDLDVFPSHIQAKMADGISHQPFVHSTDDVLMARGPASLLFD